MTEGKLLIRPAELGRGNLVTQHGNFGRTFQPHGSLRPISRRIVGIRMSTIGGDVHFVRSGLHTKYLLL
jgi:hypothetical protein